MILKIPACACGEPMVPTNKRGDLFACKNCDVPQPQEYNEAPRALTVRDRRFKLAWSQQERVFYPEQFRKGRAA